MVCTQRKTPFIGFLLGIRSIVGLYNDYVQSKQIKYLLTYKLSQVNNIYIIFIVVQWTNSIFYCTMVFFFSLGPPGVVVLCSAIGTWA